MLNEHKLAWSTCDTNVAGLQFFYGVTLGRNSMRLAIPPRKSKKRLPEILSADEINRLFAVVRNLKHRVLLSPRLLKLLRDYWRKYRPSSWLFQDQKPALADLAGRLRAVLRQLYGRIE